MQTLRGQLGTLSINENIKAVEMMTNALKRMRDKLIDLEYDDLSETDPAEMGKDVGIAMALIAEYSSKNSKANTEL